MHIKVDKARLRKQVEEKRALLTGETRRQKEESIGTGLISFFTPVFNRKTGRVLAYCAYLHAVPNRG
ncbi:hypothetical protein [Paenibacillus larvae]|uniref:hypothetical protein n=1 Tax=Paenibacillus larvae TaxID=1464 RepID=UPI00288DC0B8|nr:hypothetical protein [Paenibacillus larvae]MDT2310849.1 hypothetical protein [Paenibacillus larvae]